MSESNVERLRRNYEAYNRGEYESILADMDPGVTAHDRKEMPAGGSYLGHEGVLSAFEAVHRDFDDFRIEPVEFVDLDDQVIVVLRQSGRGRLSGLPVEGDIVHLWRIRDGKGVELRAFSTREEALEAAGASGAAGSPPGG